MGIVVIAKAKGIDARIEVKDFNGNIISGGTVLLNTVAYVYGTYEDFDGNAPASGLMIVYYDDGSGWEYRVTLFDGAVNDGQTIERTYTMTEHGYYQFRWRCTKEAAGTSGISILCTQEVAMALALTFVIPEPGTLAGLITALSAFGLLALRRIRAHKQ